MTAACVSDAVKRAEPCSLIKIKVRCEIYINE